MFRTFLKWSPAFTRNIISSNFPSVSNIRPLLCNESLRLSHTDSKTEVKVKANTRENSEEIEISSDQDKVQSIKNDPEWMLKFIKTEVAKMINNCF